MSGEILPLFRLSVIMILFIMIILIVLYFKLNSKAEDLDNDDDLSGRE